MAWSNPLPCNRRRCFESLLLVAQEVLERLTHTEVISCLLRLIIGDSTFLIRLLTYGCLYRAENH